MRRQKTLILLMITTMIIAGTAFSAFAAPPWCQPWPECKNGGEPEPPTSVDVTTFSNSGYTASSPFFNTGDLVYIQAYVATAVGDCTDCDATADIKQGTTTIDSVTLSHTGSGVYRGSWDSTGQASDTLVAFVTAANSVGEATGEDAFHVYNQGVSTYTIDADDDGDDETVLENKFLIAAFTPTNTLLELTQKFYDESYTFTTSQNRAELDESTTRGQSSSITATPAEEATSGTAGIDYTYFNNGGSYDDKGRIAGSEAFEDEEIIIAHETGIFIYEWDDNAQDYYLVTSTPNIFGGYTRGVDAGNLDGDNIQIVVTGFEPYETGYGKVYDYNNQVLTYKDTIVPGVDYDAFGVAVGNFDTITATDEIVIDSISSEDHAQAWRYNEGSLEHFTDIPRSVTTHANYGVFAEDIDGVWGDEIGMQSEDASGNWIMEARNSDTYTHKFDYLENGIGTIHDETRFADFNQDGLLDLVSVGSHGYVIVSDSATQQVMFIDTMPGATQASALGDFNNDGCWDMAIGNTNNPVAVRVYEGDCNGGFPNTFDLSVPNSPGIDMNSLDTTDIDKDGEFEIYLVEVEDPANPVNYILYVWRYDAVNQTYYMSHSKVVTNYDYSPAQLEAYDIDLDSITSGGTVINGSAHVDFTLVDENADYLKYDISGVDITNGDLVLAPIRGVLGASVTDDYAHFSDGTDDLVSNFDAGWTENTASDYVCVYDSNEDLVLGWVDYSGTSDNVGLYSVTSDEGVKVSYDSALPSASALLVYTTGDYGSIEQWMSTIRTGGLPDPNFRDDTSTEPPEPVCGNGVKEAGEECDDPDYGGLTCQDFGFDEGSLACVSCTIDTSGCSSACVVHKKCDCDGICEPNERDCGDC